MNLKNRLFHAERFWTLTDRLHKLPWFRWFRAAKWLHLSQCVGWNAANLLVWKDLSSYCESCDSQGPVPLWSHLWANWNNIKVDEFFSFQMQWKPATGKSTDQTESNLNIHVKQFWSCEDGLVGAIKMKSSEKHELVRDQTLIWSLWWKHTFPTWSLFLLPSVFSVFFSAVSEIELLEKCRLELCCYFSIWPLNSCLHSLVESNGTTSTRASCQDIHAARQWGRSPAL